MSARPPRKTQIPFRRHEKAPLRRDQGRLGQQVGQFRRGRRIDNQKWKVWLFRKVAEG